MRNNYFIYISVPGNPFLDEAYKGACYGIFLQTLQARKPPGVEDLVFCAVSAFHTPIQDLHLRFRRF